MRSIVKKYSIFIVAILNLLMFINSNYSAMIDTLKSIGVETVPTLVIMHNGEVYRRYTDKELYKLLKE